MLLFSLAAIELVQTITLDDYMGRAESYGRKREKLV
jgi:hypothetical protein